MSELHACHSMLPLFVLSADVQTTRTVHISSMNGFEMQLSSCRGRLAFTKWPDNTCTPVEQGALAQVTATISLRCQKGKQQHKLLAELNLLICRELGNGALLTSFSGSQCMLRGGNGAEVVARIPPYPLVLHQLLAQHQWAKATKLCHAVKVCISRTSHACHGTDRQDGKLSEAYVCWLNVMV